VFLVQLAGLFCRANPVTADRRRTDLVLRVFKELVTTGVDGVLPGAINERLRKLGEPMGTWEVRGALSTLEAEGEIVIDDDSGAWHLADKGNKRQRLRDTA
jgi:hypothetical protein